MDRWKEIFIEDILNKLKNGKNRHVIFIIGSAVSVGCPSKCLSVADIKRSILSPILDALKEDTDLITNITKYIKQLENSSSPKNLTSIAQAIHDLPFERFMACLYDTNKPLTEEIMNFVYGGAKKINDNHRAIARLVEILIKETKIERISILTTNYDKCIDIALEETFCSKLSLVNGIPIPGYEIEIPDGKKILYAKLHGCVGIPTSQVYTIDKMGYLILNPDWIQETYKWLTRDNKNEIDMMISIGYGFVDPDLYELFSKISKDTIIVRNEPLGFKDEKSLIGRDILKNDFFSHLLCEEKLICKSTLFIDNEKPQDKDEPSILIDLVKYFSNDSTKYKTPTRPSKDEKENICEGVRNIFMHLDKNIPLIFWGYLLNASERYEGRDIFNKAWQISSNIEIQNILAITTLHLFGNENKWKEAIKICKTLIKQKNHIELQVIGYAYRSLMYTLRHKNNILHLVWDALLAGIDLINGKIKMSFKKVNIDIEHYYTVYYIHYLVKVMDTVYQKCGPILRVNMIKVLLKRFVDKKTSLLEKQTSVITIGQILPLLNELSIIGRDANSKIFANQAKVLMSFIGGMSSALQSDRLLGWNSLADDNREGAAVNFARGFERSLNVTNQYSLADKIGAELIRVLWSDDIDGFMNLHKKDYELEEIKGACQRLREELEKRAEAQQSIKYYAHTNKDVKLITEYVLGRFGERENAIKKDIKKHRNLKRYPIFLTI
jgi:hypothetical protein